MPQIFEFKCNQCDFVFPRGWGGVMYVKNEKGEKVICPHPAEAFTIAKVLGLESGEVFAWLLRESAKITPEKKELIDTRTGFDSNCVCLDCLDQFRLDIVKEGKKCPQCGRANIKTVQESAGQICPKCKKGTVEKIDTGIIS
ncbi:MAG: hypothetical protein Q8N16_03575 [bacterium]|nr:hypothetical protein [bacterium]